MDRRVKPGDDAENWVCFYQRHARI